MNIFYFGCGNEKSGHYMWKPFNRKAELRFTYSNPWGTRIDGDLCPPNSVQGECLVHHKDGWTAISFSDQSVDKRPGSNSTFLAVGTFEFAEMVQYAWKYFPEIMDRFTFILKLKDGRDDGGNETERKEVVLDEGQKRK